MIKALINNYNMKCHEQYKHISPLLGDKLDDILKEVERFYYSEFWENRFKKRLKEEGFRFYPIELDCILGMISELREETKFLMYNKDDNSNGSSDQGVTIEFNEHSDIDIKNTIMHEFGHRQYNQQQFKLIEYLNNLILEVPGLVIKNNQTLTEKDYPYFTDKNELRQRIIPIIKEMYDNNWSAEEAYELSENLKLDDIKDIFEKEYILDLLENIL